MISRYPHSSFHLRWSRHILLGGLLLLLFLCPDPAAAVPKTDVITLVNGDVVTCEIKEMSRGKLLAKTDHLGTVSIKWDKITHIVSHYWFLIYLRDGTLVYGQMTESKQEGFLVANFQEKSTTIPMDSVVQIQPVRYNVWDRFEMSAAFGFNFNKGTNLLQVNLDAGVKYKGAIYSWGLDAGANITDKGEEDITRRNNFELWLGREISGRFHGQANVGSTRNDELGLRQRVSGGLNGGYFFLRSNHLDFLALLGAAVNREYSTGAAEPTNNSEGRIGTHFTLFYHDSPKSDISVKADAYPNFTVSDRWRFEGTVTARQEIIKDLFIKLDYYESRDNKPPDGANAKADRGIVFSIEWTK